MLLLERDIVYINSPKTYLPHLRNEIPNFYIILSEIHNLKIFNPSKIALKFISDWCDRSVKKVHRKNDIIWLEGFIINARNEFSNALNC